MEFIERINELCKERHISKKQLEREAGLSSGSTSKWKTYKPNDATMTKLAEYFGVSTSFLRGESKYRTEQEAQWAVKYDEDSLIYEADRFEQGCMIPVFDTLDTDFTEEDAIFWESIPYRLSKTGEFYGLCLKTDEYLPVIFSEDIVIIKKQSKGGEGDILILSSAEGNMLTRLFVEGDGLIVQPLNRTGHPKYYKMDAFKETFQIVGKAVELRRKFK